ncbi:hypothetical protein [Acidocella sp.]|jgi:hypothetical protein|uniref:hypothetical protein n=1 Tax=Acidocella sp. TaxID=50710 RepID=UPI00262DA444|nr:hypothetical protein [Acidocella sp.]MDD2794632.1 hypothetical protein [Acidocella sp.]
MRLVNALRYFEPLKPGATPQDRPEDFWAAYASGLVATASCGRMEIGQDVVEAAHEVIKTRPSTVLSAFHLARPPFPVTWLEWLMEPTAEIRRRGWLIVEEDCDTYSAVLFGLESDEVLIAAGIGMILRTVSGPRTGVSFSEAELQAAKKFKRQVLTISKVGRFFTKLFQRLPSGSLLTDPDYQRLVKDLSPNDIVALHELADRIEPHSIEHGSFGNAINPRDEAYGEASRLCQELVAILLLLNSRNATETGEEPDLEAINRARTRKGEPPLLPLRPVILDITRRLRAARRAGIPNAPSDLRAALVRGHFKVRKSGVFWWSPHVRGNIGEVSGRDYRVQAGR